MVGTQPEDNSLSHWCTKLLKCTHMKDCSLSRAAILFPAKTGKDTMSLFSELLHLCYNLMHSLGGF